MTWVEASLWGLFGGFAVAGLDLHRAVHRHGCWPWQARGPREVGATGYIVAELVRLIISSGLASALAESKQITTAVAALMAGVTAPLVVERLTQAIPLTDSVQDRAAVTAGKWLPTTSWTEINGQRTPVEERRACADEVEQVDPQGDHPDRVGE